MNHSEKHVFSSIHGVAWVWASKRTNSWVLFIGLCPKGSDYAKYMSVLSQSGHASKRAAMKSYLKMIPYIESQLLALRGA